MKLRTALHAVAAHHAGKPYLTACGKRVRPHAPIAPVVAVDLDQYRSERARPYRCNDGDLALDGFEHEPTGTERLFAAGYTHEPSAHGGPYAHDIIDARGTVVFTGTAHAAGEWLDGMLRGAA